MYIYIIYLYITYIYIYMYKCQQSMCYYYPTIPLSHLANILLENMGHHISHFRDDKINIVTTQYINNRHVSSIYYQNSFTDIPLFNLISIKLALSVSFRYLVFWELVGSNLNIQIAAQDLKLEAVYLQYKDSIKTR